MDIAVLLCLGLAGLALRSFRENAGGEAFRSSRKVFPDWEDVDEVTAGSWYHPLW